MAKTLKQKKKKKNRRRGKKERKRSHAGNLCGTWSPSLFVVGLTAHDASSPPAEVPDTVNVGKGHPEYLPRTPFSIPGTGGPRLPLLIADVLCILSTQ